MESIVKGFTSNTQARITGGGEGTKREVEGQEESLEKKT
jgi:hypothetical protein